MDLPKCDFKKHIKQMVKVKKKKIIKVGRIKVLVLKNK